MAQSLLAPFVVRPARFSPLLLPALVLSMGFGCSHHKRASLRPVYAGPAAPCPSGDCGSTTVPSTPSSSRTIQPSVNGPLDEPPLGSTSTTLSAPASSIDSTPMRSSTPRDTPPAVMAPVPGFPDEPDLTPVGGEQDSKVPTTKGSNKGTGAGSIKGTGLSAPTTSRKYDSPSIASRRVRQTSASLSEELRPFVNDADDLFSPPKADRPWKYIVLHHSANPKGGYDSIDHEHRKRLGWNGCGYHFVIGNGSETPDGQVEVAQRWINQKHGVHCRDGKTADVNEYGIGICLVGDFENAPPTEKQIAATRALVAYLGDRYKIAADHTETHSHLASSPTSCPGKMFPSQIILGTTSLTLR